MRVKRCMACLKKLKDNKWCNNTKCPIGKNHIKIQKLQNDK